MTRSRWQVLVLGLLLVALISQTPTVRAQTAAHLGIGIEGQNLTAGFNNTVTITVLNNYSGYIAIYDVDIAVSVPAPLAMYGDNHWHYDSIAYGQSVEVKFQVYAPVSTVGISYQGSITATYKQLGDISYTQEVHDLDLSANGWINLVLYGTQLTATKISQGGNTTVSGNVLNAGNIAAYNANVTVESAVISPTAASSVFLGEVDPNIPRPFSLLIVFKSDVPDGNYSINIRVSATDNNRPGVPIIGQGNLEIQISSAAQSASAGRPAAGRGGIIVQVLEILRNLFNAFFGSSFP